MEIRYKGVDEGIFLTLAALRKYGINEDSRNGPVRRFPEPVMLINEQPCNRVSLNPFRNANPFFHFMESMWMLAGMNELAPMLTYNSNMGDYSDDNVSLRGTAYGHKWRSHFGYDQLDLAIKRLRDNPQDRRVVLTMWDPRNEWVYPASKDLSCNLQVIFSTRNVTGGNPASADRVLDMTVTNRSNDIVYGCLGSNVYHFSMLLEFVAYHAGLRVGNYYQFSANLHGYLDNPVFKAVYENQYSPVGASPIYNGYFGGVAPLENDKHQIRRFVETGDAGNSKYLKNVGVPIFEAYRVYKLASKGIVVSGEERIRFAKSIADQCDDRQLREACVAWLDRRLTPKKFSDPMKDVRRAAETSPRPRQTIEIVEADRPE